VYNESAEYRADLVASWVPDPMVPAVPPPVLDTVVAVATDDDGGRVVSSGPADATAAGEEERLDADVEASKHARYISAFEPQAQDLNEKQTSAGAEITALVQQIQELQKATQRSIAAEMESYVESHGSNSLLEDEAGRARILELCEDIRRRCGRLSSREAKAELERLLQQAATGQPAHLQATEAGAAGPSAPGAEPGAMPLLEVPRGKQPLSLFDWRIWSQARPTLWRFGDAANLYPWRDQPLLTQECG
jgi:hypothetical protein